MFFTKYTLFAEKMFIHGKKVLYWKLFFLKKNFFYREKYKWKYKNIYINENIKIYIYLIWEIYFYVENVCVTNKI